MRETQPLQVQAYDILKRMIRDGELKSGEIYSLNKMAARFNISRTPFRDAVLRLEQEYYVDVLPSKGFQIHEMTETDIRETYQIREAIETYCLKELCKNYETERGVHCRNKLIEKIEAQKKIVATTRNQQEFADRDYEFHRNIVQATGNGYMLSIYRNFMHRISWLNDTSFRKKGRMDTALEEHIQLFDMIEKRDSAGLEKQLKYHLSTAEEINLELLKNKDAFKEE